MTATTADRATAFTAALAEGLPVMVAAVQRALPLPFPLNPGEYLTENTAPEPLLPGDGASAICAAADGALSGRVAIVVTAEMAALLGSGSDAGLVEALSPAVVAAAESLGAVLGQPVSLEDCEATDGTTALTVPPGFRAAVIGVPLLAEDEHVASLAVMFELPEEPTPEAPAAGPPAPADGPTLPAGGTTTISRELLSRLHLLGDVEMAVTAELGRTRMRVRDLLSLTPGAIVELDRAAGSPVDLLVNGTLFGRGEVVVIDEEYAVRISEIVSEAETGAAPGSPAA